MTEEQLERAKAIENDIAELLRQRAHIDNAVWVGFGSSPASNQAHCYQYPSSFNNKGVSPTISQQIVDRFIKDLSELYESLINELEQEFKNL